GSAAETEYAPPKDEAYGGADGWAPTASLRATGSQDDSAPVGDPDSDAVSSTDEDPDEKQALDTLSRNFDAMNRDHGFLGLAGDKVITEKELRETAEDSDAPVDLKRAARYILDNPDLLDRLSRSRDGDDQGIARSDIDLAREPGSDDSPAVSDPSDGGGVDDDTTAPSDL